MGLALGCPGAVELLSTTFPCVLCIPQGWSSWIPTTLPFSHADSPDPAHLLQLRISFCPRWLCPCALPKGWAAPHQALPLTGLTPAAKLLCCACGFAKATVIPARERPHTACDTAKTCGSG